MKGVGLRRQNRQSHKQDAAQRSDAPVPVVFRVHNDDMSRAQFLFSPKNFGLPVPAAAAGTTATGAGEAASSPLGVPAVEAIIELASFFPAYGEAAKQTNGTAMSSSVSSPAGMPTSRGSQAQLAGDSFASSPPSFPRGGDGAPPPPQQQQQQQQQQQAMAALTRAVSNSSFSLGANTGSYVDLFSLSSFVSSPVRATAATAETAAGATMAPPGTTGPSTKGSPAVTTDSAPSAQRLVGGGSMGALVNQLLTQRGWMMSSASEGAAAGAGSVMGVGGGLTSSGGTPLTDRGDATTNGEGAGVLGGAAGVLEPSAEGGGMMHPSGGWICRAMAFTARDMQYSSGAISVNQSLTTKCPLINDVAKGRIMARVLSDYAEVERRYGLSHVELSFEHQFVSRSDMFLISEALRERILYHGEELHVCGFRFKVNEMLQAFPLPDMAAEGAGQSAAIPLQPQPQHPPQQPHTASGAGLASGGRPEDLSLPSQQQQQQQQQHHGQTTTSTTGAASHATEGKKKLLLLRVHCGLVTPQTTINFTSRSPVHYVIVELTKEMWDTTLDGRIGITWAIRKFLRELILVQLPKRKATPLLRIVFTGRLRREYALDDNTDVFHMLEIPKDLRSTGSSSSSSSGGGGGGSVPAAGFASGYYENVFADSLSAALGGNGTATGVGGSPSGGGAATSGGSGAASGGKPSAGGAPSHGTAADVVDEVDRHCHAFVERILSQIKETALKKLMWECGRLAVARGASEEDHNSEDAKPNIVGKEARGEPATADSTRFDADLKQYLHDGIKRVRRLSARHVFSHAKESNTLEALSIVLERCSHHYLDRRLAVTGHAVTVVSAGKGIYQATNSLVQINCARLHDVGLRRVHVVCVGRPPLHVTPLLEYSAADDTLRAQYHLQSSDVARVAAAMMGGDIRDSLVGAAAPWAASAATAAVSPPPPQRYYEQPEWMTTYFYHPRVEVGSGALTFELLPKEAWLLAHHYAVTDPALPAPATSPRSGAPSDVYAGRVPPAGATPPVAGEVDTALVKPPNQRYAATVSSAFVHGQHVMIPGLGLRDFRLPRVVFPANAVTIGALALLHCRQQIHGTGMAECVRQYQALCAARAARAASRIRKEQQKPARNETDTPQERPRQLSPAFPPVRRVSSGFERSLHGSSVPITHNADSRDGTAGVDDNAAPPSGARFQLPRPAGFAGGSSLDRHPRGEGTLVVSRSCDYKTSPNPEYALMGEFHHEQMQQQQQQAGARWHASTPLGSPSQRAAPQPPLGMTPLQSSSWRSNLTLASNPAVPSGPSPTGHGAVTIGGGGGNHTSLFVPASSYERRRAELGGPILNTGPEDDTASAHTASSFDPQTHRLRRASWVLDDGTLYRSGAVTGAGRGTALRQRSGGGVLPFVVSTWFCVHGTKNTSTATVRSLGSGDGRKQANAIAKDPHHLTEDHDTYTGTGGVGSVRPWVRPSSCTRRDVSLCGANVVDSDLKNGYLILELTISPEVLPGAYWSPLLLVQDERWKLLMSCFSGRDDRLSLSVQDALDDFASDLRPGEVFCRTFSGITEDGRTLILPTHSNTASFQSPEELMFQYAPELFTPVPHVAVVEAQSRPVAAASLSPSSSPTRDAGAAPPHIPSLDPTATAEAEEPVGFSCSPNQADPPQAEPLRSEGGGGGGSGLAAALDTGSACLVRSPPMTVVSAITEGTNHAEASTSLAPAALPAGASGEAKAAAPPPSFTIVSASSQGGEGYSTTLRDPNTGSTVAPLPQLLPGTTTGIGYVQLRNSLLFAIQPTSPLPTDDEVGAALVAGLNAGGDSASPYYTYKGLLAALLHGYLGGGGGGGGGSGLPAMTATGSGGAGAVAAGGAGMTSVAAGSSMAGPVATTGAGGGGGPSAGITTTSGLPQSMENVTTRVVLRRRWLFQHPDIGLESPCDASWSSLCASKVLPLYGSKSVYPRDSFYTVSPHQYTVTGTSGSSGAAGGKGLTSPSSTGSMSGSGAGGGGASTLGSRQRGDNADAITITGRPLNNAQDEDRKRLLEFILQRLQQQYQIVVDGGVGASYPLLWPRAAPQPNIRLDMSIGHQTHTLKVGETGRTVSITRMLHRGMYSNGQVTHMVSYRYALWNYLQNSFDPREMHMEAQVGEKNAYCWEALDRWVQERPDAYIPRGPELWLRSREIAVVLLPENPDDPPSFEEFHGFIGYRFSNYLATRGKVAWHLNSDPLSLDIPSPTPAEFPAPLAVMPVVLVRDNAKAALETRSLVDHATGRTVAFDRPVDERLMSVDIILPAQYNRSCHYLLKVSWLSCAANIVTDWYGSFMANAQRYRFRAMPISCYNQNPKAESLAAHYDVVAKVRSKGRAASADDMPPEIARWHSNESSSGGSNVGGGSVADRMADKGYAEGRRTHEGDGHASGVSVVAETPLEEPVLRRHLLTLLTERRFHYYPDIPAMSRNCRLVHFSGLCYVVVPPSSTVVAQWYQNTCVQQGTPAQRQLLTQFREAVKAAKRATKKELAAAAAATPTRGIPPEESTQ